MQLQTKRNQGRRQS